MENLVAKAVILGDGAVGKTSIVHRWVDDRFLTRYVATIGVDILTKSVEVTVDGSSYQVRLDLWDIAGQEHFRTLRSKFYKRAVGTILVFDVTNRRSFDSLERWLEETAESVPDPIPHVLVANKCDLKELRTISYEETQSKAKELGIAYVVETSALTGEGIQEAFEFLGKTVAQSLKEQDSQKTGT